MSGAYTEDMDDRSLLTIVCPECGFKADVVVLFGEPDLSLRHEGPRHWLRFTGSGTLDHVTWDDFAVAPLAGIMRVDRYDVTA